MKKKDTADKGKFESIWEDNTLIYKGALLKLTMVNNQEKIVRVADNLSGRLGALVYHEEIGTFLFDFFKLPISRQELSYHIFEHRPFVGSIEFL